MTAQNISAIIIAMALITGCQSGTGGPEATEQAEKETWEAELEGQIGLLGHRNWVVVADAAYPLQSNPGIRTILSDQDHLATVRKTLEVINSRDHVSPIVYLDSESVYLTDDAAPGIAAFREELEGILQGFTPEYAMHEEIIGMLDQSAELYNVLIIKTDFTLPYTTVFLQLDCAYWGPEDEAALRETISVQ